MSALDDTPVIDDDELRELGEDIREEMEIIAELDCPFSPRARAFLRWLNGVDQP